ETAALPDLQHYVLQLHSHLSSLTQLEYELENGRAIVVASERSCDSRSIFAALDYATILRAGLFAVSLPTPDYKLAATFPDWRVAFVTMLSAGIVANKVEHQNEAFDDAMKRMPSRLISESVLFDSSKVICNERRKKYSDVLGA